MGGAGLPEQEPEQNFGSWTHSDSGRQELSPCREELGRGRAGAEATERTQAHLDTLPKAKREGGTPRLFSCALSFQPPGIPTGPSNTSVVFWNLSSRKQDRERTQNSSESKQANDWSLALIVLKIVNSPI